MSDAPKSAFEIAMEKLRARDAERGEKPGKPLTKDQKKRIAELRRYYASKIAEREILYRSEMRKTHGEAEKQREVEEAYVVDRRRLLAEQEAKIREIRGPSADPTPPQRE